jgi:hypothetical protein
MKYIKLFENLTSTKYLRKKLLLFNLSWQELLMFLEDENFDINKLEELNNVNNKFINKGSSGLVYSYNDKIIKITTDIYDYKLVYKLINKNAEYLPKIYDVKSLNNKKTILLAILMDRCEKLPDEIYNLIKRNRDCISEFFKYSDEYYLTIGLNFEEKKVFEKYNLLASFNGIKEELEKFGINKYNLDIHANNFMMKNNHLCFIDAITPKRYYKS